MPSSSVLADLGYRYFGQPATLDLGNRTTSRQQGNSQLHRDGRLNGLECRQRHLNVDRRSPRFS